MVKLNIEKVFWDVLNGLDWKCVVEVFGWDLLEVSCFLNGQCGVMIGEIDRVIDVVGYVLVSWLYFDVIVMFCKVGVVCECVWQGVGECGFC